ARNPLGPVSERCESLRTANARKCCYAQHPSHCQQFIVRLRTNSDDPPHAGHLRRNHGHQQCGHQGQPAAGNIASEGRNRPHNLADSHARLNLQIPVPGLLPLRHMPHILRGMCRRMQELAADTLARRSILFPRNPQTVSCQVPAVQLLRPLIQRLVAVLAHFGHNSPRGDQRRAILPFANLHQLRFCSLRQFQDAHHSTILFKGYSTIPCAFAAFSLGRICRSTASSTMVFTATQSASLSSEIVGFFSAGSTCNTPARFSRLTFSIKPTFVAAAIAPCSINTRFSAFSRFAGSSADLRFMMNTVEDSSTISRIRK